MMISKNRPVQIVADKGMVLTNGEVYSTEGGYITLGVNDSPDNWREITAEEAEKLQNKENEGVEENENMY
jgi:hypothetical protein